MDPKPGQGEELTRSRMTSLVKTCAAVPCESFETQSYWSLLLAEFSVSSTVVATRCFSSPQALQRHPQRSQKLKALDVVSVPPTCRPESQKTSLCRSLNTWQLKNKCKKLRSTFQAPEKKLSVVCANTLS